MNWTAIFFQGWSDLARTAVVGVLAYAALVVLLRASGKRTLAKLNAFDLVVTIALGSTLSAVLLQESIALAEGALAFATLIGLQFAVTSLSIRSERFASFIRSEPTLLARNGELLTGAMKHQRITSEEVLAAARAAGATDVASIAFVILESDGSLSTGVSHLTRPHRHRPGPAGSGAR